MSSRTYDLAYYLNWAGADHAFIEYVKSGKTVIIELEEKKGEIIKNVGK